MLHIVDSFGRIGEENAFAVLARATALQPTLNCFVTVIPRQPVFYRCARRLRLICTSDSG